MTKKIQTTNRIRIKNATIYASCDAVREIKHHLTRCNQVLVPNKGSLPHLMEDLRAMMSSHKWENHFPKSSIAIVLQPQPSS